jgi:deoxycytidylate deaminase
METKNQKTVAYPYLPEGRTILYVPLSNLYMAEAKEFARLNSLDKSIQTGSIIVKDGKIIGRGANGSTYHEKNVCERVKLKIPTGQGYELCEGCHPKNHSEPKAVKNAKDLGYDTKGADLYLWGHWWFCEPCWNVIISAGIKNVYILENSENLFNRESPDNIIGKQFE